MKHKNSVGLGKLIYMEWLFPIKDYYSSIRRNELVFEIIFPVILSILITAIYNSKNKMNYALEGLSNLLPTAVSILIGFTVMLITILLTGSGDNINLLKEKKNTKELYGKRFSLYQGLHIQFSHSLLSEVFLLLLVFLYLFWNGLGIPTWVEIILLFWEILLTLNILLSILRGIVNVYFSFYNAK